MRHQIHFGSKQIDFTLEYQNRRSLGIKVYPNSSVRVLAPANSLEKEVFQKVRAKGHWILKQIAHFDSFRPATPPRRYISGETHLYLGRQYKLKVIADTENVVKAYRGQLLVYATDTSPKKVEIQLHQWYRQRALIIFDELLDELLPKFRKYKIAKPILSIRLMTKRWGSCTPGGKILLNLELIKAPKGSIEYVMIHELCHLVYHSHTKDFFDLQTRILPDCKKWKDRLEYILA